MPGEHLTRCLASGAARMDADRLSHEEKVDRWSTGS